MSELPPSGATFSAPAQLFVRTERAVLSAAEQPSQVAAVFNPQAGDFRRRELHRAVVLFTGLEARLDHPRVSALGRELHSLLPFGFPSQGPSALQPGIAEQCGGHVGLPRPSRPSGGRA